MAQVKRALEWLQGERVEPKRFAAVLILKVCNLPSQGKLFELVQSISLFVRAD